VYLYPGTFIFSCFQKLGNFSLLILHNVVFFVFLQFQSTDGEFELYFAVKKQSISAVNLETGCRIRLILIEMLSHRLFDNVEKIFRTVSFRCAGAKLCAYFFWLERKQVFYVFHQNVREMKPNETTTEFSVLVTGSCGSLALLQ
jgi:hypothetical protein